MTRVEVGNLQFFDFTRAVVFRALNYLGSCIGIQVANMSMLWLRLLNDGPTPSCFAFIWNSAFSFDATVTKEKLSGHYKRFKYSIILESFEIKAVVILQHRTYLSSWQAAKGDILGREAPFELLWLSLSSDSDKERQVLYCFVQLLVLKTIGADLNRIKSTFSCFSF